MKTPAQKTIKWIVFAIFLIYAATLIFPFAWMFLNSLKSNSQFFSDIWGFPKPITFSNYYRAFTEFKVTTAAGEFNLLSMFFISLFLTLSATLVNTLLSTMAAYVVAKYKFPGRNLIFALALFAMILPTAGTLTAQYQLMVNIKLYDTIFGILVLYSGSFGFTFFIMNGIFKNISWTYAEAGFMDGASDFKVFLKIMMPMARPTMISLGVIYAIGIWNDYMTPSIYLKKYPTLAVGLRRLTNAMMSSSNYAEMFAAMILSLVPILIVFVCFQKTIMENTVAGGLKG